MPTAAVKRYWSLVAALGCLICGQPALIAHMHGPSLRERNPQFLKPKGKKPRWGDYLVAPLCPDHHFMCDNSPAEFDAWYGTPAQMVDRVGERLGVNPWAAAEAELKPLPARSAAASLQTSDVDEP